MRLYSPNALANIADFLTRTDFTRDLLRTVAEDLSIWSQANTRAYNEEHGKALSVVSTTSILQAYDEESFRYDRARALSDLHMMHDNAGQPYLWQSFDLPLFYCAHGRIMERAFTRLLSDLIKIAHMAMSVK